VSEQEHLRNCIATHSEANFVLISIKEKQKINAREWPVEVDGKLEIVVQDSYLIPKKDYLLEQIQMQPKMKFPRRNI
jgi:hypothetical protein